jgi:DmsE family decaheme c-type cytochrome
VRTIPSNRIRFGVRGRGLILIGGLCLVLASCRSQHEPTVRCDPELPSRAAVPVEQGWPRPNNFFTQVSYQEVRATMPKIQGAEYVNDDEICANCHGIYAKTFAEGNVHRGEGCEACHGPASKHVEARGKEPGLIFSFKTGPDKSGIVLAEACLRCHGENQCAQGTRWRTSKHAQCGVTCVSCHRGHYNVPPGTPATTEPQSAELLRPQVKLASFKLDDTLKKPAAAAKLPSLRGTSGHMGANAPGLCFHCHANKMDLARVAGPHQICGTNGFNCTTCHDPHGTLKESSRTDLCLSCHKGAPTMAWHSSIHQNNGVACTDCHNPHPDATVPRFVNIDHYKVERPKRLAMSVQEPEACYKCHAKIYGLNAMPYHHPVKEGKMVCSDCHDPHGQYLRNLKEETINLLCYKCHAEKQGPFAFEHPPVTENCCICHEPHGTVAKNLLRQPVTFLCLRCHAGHAATSHANILAGSGSSGNSNLVTAQQFQKALYTDCTHCHAQIHGTDRASVTGHGYLMR